MAPHQMDCPATPSTTSPRPTTMPAAPIAMPRRMRARAAEPCICEANFGSSAYNACSICSSRCCSCSESGTFDLPWAAPLYDINVPRCRLVAKTGVAWCSRQPSHPIPLSGYVAALRSGSRALTFNQTGRKNRAGTEPCTGLIDRAVGVTPAMLRLIEQTLYLCLVAVQETFHPNANQPQAGALQAQSVKECPRGRVDVAADVSRVTQGLGTVSYTHLRAHETVLDLVCRLLLETKK